MSDEYVTLDPESERRLIKKIVEELRRGGSGESEPEGSGSLEELKEGAAQEVAENPVQGLSEAYKAMYGKKQQKE